MWGGLVLWLPRKFVCVWGGVLGDAPFLDIRDQEIYVHEVLAAA